MPESTPASAGPRVSDEELAKWCAYWQGCIEGDSTYADWDEVKATFDLADCRTALAAANARIAVLEGERDGYKSLLFDYAHDHAEQIMEIAGGSQPLPPDKSWDVWCHALAITHLDIDIITGDPEYATLATASPEPGAAHE